jgi:micrococcal nuclease
MYEYKAELIRVVDGDTVDLMVDLGFNIQIKERFRLEGIDAPESRTLDLEEKARGLAAARHLKILFESVPFGCLLVRTKVDSKGKYGRYLGKLIAIYPDNPGEWDLNNAMVIAGHAVFKHY